MQGSQGEPSREAKRKRERQPMLGHCWANVQHHSVQCSREKRKGWQAWVGTELGVVHWQDKGL